MWLAAAVDDMDEVAAVFAIVVTALASVVRTVVVVVLALLQHEFCIVEQTFVGDGGACAEPDGLADFRVDDTEFCHQKQNQSKHCAETRYKAKREDKLINYLWYV